MQTCFVCHQVTGEGLPGQIPPLAKSDFLMGDKERSIRFVLRGQTGEIVVNGKKFNGTMAPLNNLSDDEVANALTYVRNSFGNSGDAVTPKPCARSAPKPRRLRPTNTNRNPETHEGSTQMQTFPGGTMLIGNCRRCRRALGCYKTCGNGARSCGSLYAALPRRAGSENNPGGRLL